jgi:hypothetical protein
VSGAARSAGAWVALGTLILLVVTNGIALGLLQVGGPLIGLALYVVLMWRWQKRDYRSAVIGGIIGLVVHMAEAAMTGWSAYPALMALNMILPAALALAAWFADR